MVNIFAREITDDLASLVKQVDTLVGENQDKRMAGFVVLLTEDPDEAEAQLKALAKKHDIKNVPLTIFDGSAGPPRYKIAKDADVTVLTWVRARVKANHAFAKGDLNKESVAKVVEDAKALVN